MRTLLTQINNGINKIKSEDYTNGKSTTYNR